MRAHPSHRCCHSPAPPHRSGRGRERRSSKQIWQRVIVGTMRGRAREPRERRGGFGVWWERVQFHLAGGGGAQVRWMTPVGVVALGWEADGGDWGGNLWWIRLWAAYIREQVLGFGLDIHYTRMGTTGGGIPSVTFFESVIKNPSQISRFLVV